MTKNGRLNLKLNLKNQKILTLNQKEDLESQMNQKYQRGVPPKPKREVVHGTQYTKHAETWHA